MENIIYYIHDAESNDHLYCKEIYVDYKTIDKHVGNSI